MDRININRSVNLGRCDYFICNDMKYYGKCRGYEVYLWKFNKSHIFQLLDMSDENKNGFKVVAEITLDRSYMGKSWQCSYTRVDSDYQGLGIAMYAYKFIMSFGYVLEAGHSQSKGSRKLWWSLSKQRNVIMIAKEKGSRESWIMPERDNKVKELRSDFFDIYDGPKDVNVYAYMVQ